MTDVFIIGNGESRKGFDLTSLRKYGKIYGCNALYRDFQPDVLISVDQRMIKEIMESGYAYKNECYFRKCDQWKKEFNIEGDMMKDLKIYYPDEDDPGWSSGAIAAHIANVKEKPERMFMIGCDFNSNTDMINNIYKGTNGYWISDHPKVPHINWVKQFSDVFTKLFNTEIIVVLNKKFEGMNINKSMTIFDSFKNLKIIFYEDLINILC